jgi:hypothetical protein
MIKEIDYLILLLSPQAALLKGSSQLYYGTLYRNKMFIITSHIKHSDGVMKGKM